MAEEDVVVVYKDPLTTEMVRAGQRLLGALDAAGHSPTACFWLFIPEAERWRLYFADAELRATGPIVAYSRIMEILDRLPDLSNVLHLWDTAVISPDDPVACALRSAASSGYGEGDRITRIAFDSYYIEDAHIYRAG